MSAEQGSLGAAVEPSARLCCGGRALWAPGPADGVAVARLEQLFERVCDDVGRHRPDQLAVDARAPGADGPTLTYDELDARANQLAHHLLDGHLDHPGRRVALYLDDPVDGYVATLAVLKAGATFVPLDVSFPPSRVAHIAGDAGVEVVVSRSHLDAGLAELDPASAVVALDRVAGDVARRPAGRPPVPMAGPDALAYIIYTSGTTGAPKGVAVSHRSICNFLTVAAACYGIRADDRVYQGLTMAFDFSFEDTWVPWAVGATLVPRPPGVTLVGRDLDVFIEERGITALVCVPTLLATLRPDHPGLRFVLASGEACPPALVERWHAEGRRLLNVYGPTEATVTATWTRLRPGRPVTIGVPLPTYSVVVLDPDGDRVLEPGERGELCLGGVGLAEGYLGLPERTAAAFVPDPVGLPDNPSGRIYRTGDLGRFTPDGEVEHLGRLDAQVKVRGYRIELAEVEAVLQAAPGVAQAVVTTHDTGAGPVELVGWYRSEGPGHRPDGTGSPDPEAVRRYLADRLPAYMVPAYLEEIDEVPMAATGKADRAALGPPRHGRRAAPGRHEDPGSDVEARLAALLGEVLGEERVSVTADVFADLGANSLLMAHFAAAVDEDGALPPVSMRDLYLHPSIRALAAAMTDRATDAAAAADPAGPAPAGPAPAGGTTTPAGATTPAGVIADPGAPVGRPHLRLCGAAQVVAFLAYVAAAGAVLDVGGRWMAGGAGVVGVYGRAVALGAVLLVATGGAPVAAKWLLVGRFRPRRIRVWSPAYLRFWVVKTLVASNPVARVAVGTPLYNLYLRALGARIGPGAAIHTRHVPVCADLITVGAGAVVQRDGWMAGYRAVDGVIEVGPVTVGAGAHVGERAVLDIGSTMEDGARLAHASSLHDGQVVPAGESWHGSPAEPGGPPAPDLEALPARRGRAGLGCVARLSLVALVLGPLEAGLSTTLVTHPAWLDGLSVPDELGVAAAVVAGLVALGLLVVATVPRLAAAAIQPGRAYPRHGIHHTLARLADVTSNLRPLTALFGDSVLIVGYLRAVGYRLGVVDQTGSNFGMSVRQGCPTLCAVGTGTMVSDGLSIVTTDLTATSFRLRPATVGRHNFLGNDVVFPAGARVGDDCLLATKVGVPLTGPLRQGVGLLGSPCFEIPRTVERDRDLVGHPEGEERRRRIRAKTRHNLITIGLHLLVRWLWLAGLLVVGLTAWTGGTGWPDLGETVATTVADLCLTVVLYAVAERAVLGWRPLRPRSCSIYDRAFWDHERFWKVPSTTHVQLLNGTPLKPWAWRLLGVQVGPGVFDDGCQVVERSMVAIGAGATLNAGAVLQGHSLEDGAFKSGTIRVGAGATVGVGAFIHYGVELGPHTSVAADAFVMKGTRAAPRTRWSGNPARQLTRPTPPPERSTP